MQSLFYNKFTSQPLTISRVTYKYALWDAVYLEIYGKKFEHWLIPYQTSTAFKLTKKKRIAQLF